VRKRHHVSVPCNGAICLRALEETAAWSDLEACRPEWLTVVDSPDAFVHEGWPVYAGPDVVYRPRRAQQGGIEVIAARICERVADKARAEDAGDHQFAV
jgi:hypothetical protein